MTFWQWFLRFDTKAQVIIEKTYKWNYMKIKNIYTSEGTINSVKNNLKSRIHKELLQLNNQKIGKELE